MMSKATHKLILKKELLRTLDEGDLRVVNGGKGYPSHDAEFSYVRPQPFSLMGGPP